MSLLPRHQDEVNTARLRAPSSDVGFHIYRNTSRGVGEHHHSICEFSLIVDGVGVESVNGRAYRVQAGSATLRLPHQVHSLSADPGSVVDKVGCMFDLNMLFGTPYESTWCGRLCQVGRRYDSSVLLGGEDHDAILTALRSLESEYANPGRFGQAEMIRGLLTQALTVFMRRTAPASPADPAATSRQAAAFSAVLHHVHDNYTGPISLASASAAAGLTPSYVSRLFRELGGCTFLTYVHELRVSSAEAMLVSTDMSASDIAAEVGFESFRTFARVFSGSHGCSPGRYRTMRRASIRR